MDTSEKYYKVLSADALEEGEGKIVHAGVKKLALFKIDGEFHCIQNYCPHAGGFLGLGELKGSVVRCPRHNWGFDVKTGDCKTNARYSARTYPTRVEDGDVYVGVPEDGTIL